MLSVISFLLKKLTHPGSSFGQVVSWSRCLMDFFCSEDSDDKHESDQKQNHQPEAFHLLNALSDLMMLPLGTFRDASTRKEVCPILGTSIIKRVLNNFVPDEFSPDPIPESLLRAIDFEGPLETTEESISAFPCAMNPVIYSPTPAASLLHMIGDENHQKGGTSIIRKSYNSDDELDKLNMPLSGINTENIRISPASTNPNWVPKGKGGRNVVRYALLQEVWRNSS
ncbi:hypothetical protein Dimus_015237 [Dionaea muscipula]